MRPTISGRPSELDAVKPVLADGVREVGVYTKRDTKCMDCGAGKTELMHR